MSELYIAKNLVFHKSTKHIKVDCHFILEKVINKELTLEYTNMEDQLAEFLTKAVTKQQLYDLSSKLGIVKIYA